MASQTPQPVEVLFSYAREDEGLRDKLGKQLKALEVEGVVRAWYDRDIVAGQRWDDEIDARLNSADIILLLVSSDFLASDYCRTVEIERALERDAAGEACVIPVILRPCQWQRTVLGSLQALPKDGNPVTLWPNIDEAFLDVADGVSRAIEELRSKQTARPTKPEEKEAAAVATLIPRPPVIGFVSRRDPQGRDIVARLKEELAPGRNQLVTLSGPGGIGKTTLAAESARALQEPYENRIVWSSADGRADFTLLSLLDDIATQLGRADLRTLAPAAKEEQVRALAADALVVLDNYETVAEAGRKGVEGWLRSGRCSALFTSRPHVEGTRLVRVSAMSREEAEEFLERLTAEQAVEPQAFTPDVRRRVYETAEANPHVMQWVVGQIDGARVPDTVFEELAGGEGDAAERVFARSFNLPQLGEDGRDALLALSLFAPSASREALAQVAGFGDDWAKRLDEAVRNLHALWLVKGVDGYRRLAAEGLTRSMAAARLSEDVRGDEFRRRFVTYFLRYAVERQEPTPENYDALEGEKDNLLGASEVAFASGDRGSVMRMAYALAGADVGMLGVRGYWGEAAKLDEQALQAARSLQDEAQIAGLSHNLAMMYQNRGELAEARRLYDASLEIKARLGDQHGVAISLHQLGRLAQERGEHEAAYRLYDASLEIAKGLGDQSGVASTLHNLAALAQNRGELEEARRLYDESLKINKRLGDPRGVAISLHQLAMLAQNRGELAEARRLYDESLEIKTRLGDQRGVAGTLHNLAALAQERGELEAARRLYYKSLEIKTRLGNQGGVASTLHQLGMLAEREGDKEGAAQLYRESLSIFEKLGSPYAVMARESLARVEGKSS